MSQSFARRTSSPAAVRVRVSQVDVITSNYFLASNGRDAKTFRIIIVGQSLPEFHDQSAKKTCFGASDSALSMMLTNQASSN